MSRPEISIVIPTRNRATLAQVAIQSVLDSGGPDVEVVVADNSDISIEVPDDPRVKLIPRPDKVITMTDNWERALHVARGEWVTFLSDKHRLVPALYRRAIDLARRAKLKVVTFERASLFQALPPDAVTVDALWRQHGTLLSPDSPERVETIEARETMAEWFRLIRGASRRPQIYRGALHRSVVEAALRKTPQFFFGTCPDYASGLQCMSEVERYLATNLPAVVSHFPTADIGAWSPARSLDQGGALGNERIREAGYDAFTRYHLPVTVTSSILETLLEFRRLRPDACRGIEIDWNRYAWLATNEIENMHLSSTERWRRHRMVMRASQTDGLDLGPLSTVARVVVTRRSDAVARGYREIKRMIGITVPQPKVSAESWSERKVASLAEARIELAQEFGVRESAAS